jgi:amidohydrolase
VGNFLSEAHELFDYTRGLRRDFHRHPELGFQEVRTAGVVARELNALGLEVTTGIAETGVMALLEGEAKGPVVLARFDMDALPIQEETGAEYTSQTPGVMHACGHDGHTAIGLTVARLLAVHREQLAGTVKFVFQPAEEGLGGAEGMIGAGVLENPEPDVALALHLWNEQPLGWIGVSPGPVMAAADIFHLLITGKGGHGGAPHMTVDPVVTASQIITSLQTIVSRNVPPLKSAVVSVTTLDGGEAYNVIPPVVNLRGTIRTFDPDVRELVLERFRQITTGLAQAFNCEIDIFLEHLSPAVVNDENVTLRVQEVVKQLSVDADLDTDHRLMVSEDMSLMMQSIPGCYFLVGSANPEKGLDAGHHHPRFDFDEQVLPRASALMAGVVASYLIPHELSWQRQ